MAEYDQRIQEILSQQDDSAADQAAIAGYGQAGATIGAALAGQKADPRFYQQLQANAAKRMQAEKDRKMKLLSYLNQQEQDKADQAIAQTRHDERMGLQQEQIAATKEHREKTTDLAEKKFEQQKTDADKQFELDWAKLNKKKDKKAPVDKKLARQQMELATRTNNIKANIKKLKERIEDKGTWEAFGPHSRVLDQALNDIAVDYAKMVDPDSVARESEVAQAKKMLQITGLGVRNSTALATLDEFRDQLETRINSRRVAQGLPPLQKTGVDDPGGGLVEEAIASDAQMFKVKHPKTGEVRMVPAASLKKYLDKGGQLVE